MMTATDQTQSCAHDTSASAREEKAKRRSAEKIYRAAVSSGPALVRLPSSTVCHAIIHKNRELRHQGFRSDRPGEERDDYLARLFQPTTRVKLDGQMIQDIIAEYADCMARMVDGECAILKSAISYVAYTKRAMFEEQTGEAI
jgi:hypothetical protein